MNGHWIVQPGTLVHCAADSWLHGVIVPAQLLEPTL